MSPYTMEQSIHEGKLELKALFQYVKNNAETLDLYQIESGIKEYLNKPGMAAVHCYFAKKGVGARELIHPGKRCARCVNVALVARTVSRHDRNETATLTTLLHNSCPEYNHGAKCV